MSPWRVAGATDVGRERQRNEDALGVRELDDGSWVLVVCDGMGGHTAGDVASRTAVAHLLGLLSRPDGDPEPYRAIHEALVGADHAVRAAADGSDMGTTAVVARLLGSSAWIGWVGDSRLYVVRDGAVVERTQDHTQVAAMLARGELTVHEAHHHPLAHVLTQALGMSPAGLRPTVYAEPVPCRPGDALLLCSDGLHDLVDDAELPGELAGRSPEEAVQHLVDLANARGGHDNVTAVVALLDAERVPGAPPAPAPPRRTLDEPVPPPPSLPLPWVAVLVVLALLAGALVGFLWPAPGENDPSKSHEVTPTSKDSPDEAVEP